MYEKEKRGAEVRALAGRLYAEHSKELMRIARRHSVGAADAEEAVQEAFVSFIRHFDPARGAPAIAWLTLTLKRQCWRQARDGHAGRRVIAPAESETEEPGQLLGSIAAGEDTEGIVLELDEARRRLDALSGDQREALVMHAAGFSYAEIAAMRDWTRTKTDRCLRRGRARLRAEEGPDGR